MLILGSSSSARYELLVAAGLKPSKVLAPEIDESQNNLESPIDYVKRVANEKAISLNSKPDDLLITADTVVVSNRQVLHKTAEKKIARKHLETLSGKRHRVFTAVAIKHRDKLMCFLVKTILKMKRLSNKEIDQYLMTKEWIGKAGAYSIQGKAMSFFIFISGCHSNVVGMPIPKLVSVLKSMKF